MVTFSSAFARSVCPGPKYVDDLERIGLKLCHWRAEPLGMVQADNTDFAYSWTDGTLGLFVHEITADGLQITASATEDLIAVAIPLEPNPHRTLTVEEISTSERAHCIEFISLPCHSSITVRGAQKGMRSITLLVRTENISDLCGPIDDLPEFLARMTREHHGMIRSHSFPCLVERVARDIWEAARGDHFSPLFCRYKAAELLNALFEYWIVEDRNIDAFLCSEKERLGVFKVRDLIEADPVNMPPIDELARQAGMNRTKLRYLFKQLCGMTMVDFRTTLVMRTADTMLRGSKLPVADISFQLGYAESSSFNTAYRRFFGHTPGRTRRL